MLHHAAGAGPALPADAGTPVPKSSGLPGKPAEVPNPVHYSIFLCARQHLKTRVNTCKTASNPTPTDLISGNPALCRRPLHRQALRQRGAQGAGPIKATHGLDALPPEVISLVVDSQLPRPGQPSSGSYEGDGYITVRHPDTPVVTEALKRLVTTVRVELG